MDIVAMGSDIVECLRIGRMIEEHGEQFLNRVYTEREIRYCQSRKHATEHFASRWAAKEAIFRCLGAHSGAMSWTEIEIRNDATGAAKVHVCGAVKELAVNRRIADILITLAHCRAYATATALAVRDS